MKRAILAGVLAAVVASAGTTAALLLAGDPSPSPRGDQGSGITDVARIVCHESRTEVITASVQPQRDGLHALVENRGSERVTFAVEEDAAVGWFASKGTNRISPGFAKETVWLVLPGRVTVSCHPTSLMGPARGRLVASLEVVDPSSIYVSEELQCAREPTPSYGVSFGFGLPGIPGGPVQIIRQALRGLRPGDTVERAGYPEQVFPALVRVVRNGRTIAVAVLDRYGEDSILVCGDSGIQARQD